MSGNTVLVAEDNATLVPLIRSVIARSRRQAVFALDGAMALELYEEHRPEIELVIADAGLPGVGGVELAEELRRRDPDLPILLISGWFGGEPTGFPQLDKPFGLAELEQRIAELLDAR